MEGEIIVESGVSWLRDKIIQTAEDRIETLKEGIAEGVPLHEYGPMVGRYKEAKRWRDWIVQELFAEFQQHEDATFEEDGLEEMPDE